MSVWDISTPKGTEDKSLGAGRIRELKEALQDALEAGGHFPVSTSSPVYYASLQADTEANRPAASTDYEGRWFYNTTTKQIQRDTGTAWENITTDKTVIPSGTKTVFIESAAPTGWTQVTTVNDKILRIAASGGSTGGTDSISTPPTHTHGGATSTDAITHSHTLTWDRPNSLFGALGTLVSSISTSTDNYTGTHSHTISADTAFAPKYVNAIICSKD